MVQVLTKGVVAACLSTGAAGFGTSRANQRRHQTPSSLFSTLSPFYSPSGYLDYTGEQFDVAEDAPRNVGAFESSCSEYGIQCAEGFKLVDGDGDGRNIYAVTQTDVPSGSSVLYVPESLILSSNKAMAELSTPEMEEAEQFVIQEGAESELRHYYLMLKLLQEIQNGSASQWYAWLQSLPRYFSNAVAMTEYCLLCLPPLLRTLGRDERENQRELSLDSIDMVPFISDEIKTHPGDLIKWVYQIVYTRAVETEDGDLKIVPMADYFNHGSEYTEIEASYDAEGNYYGYTSYDVPAGQALRISYGSRNPSHLLARYGFLDEDCPATYCKLLPPTVNQDMLDLGYSYDRMLFYKTGEVADEVWDIFLYQHLVEINSIPGHPSHDLNPQHALMTAHRTGDYDAKLALHDKYYEATSAALLKHVDDFIEDMDKLIQKAAIIGVEDPNSAYIRYEHPRLPLIHQHNLFVRETFQNVRDRYSPDQGVNWREATRVMVQECDEVAGECAIAECEVDFQGNWQCEGGLGLNADGSERWQKTQTVIG